VDLDLPAAPASPVSADGTIAFGTYRGHTGPIDWAPARRTRGRRSGGWKRWHYVSVAGPEVVLAVAVIDLGWAASAFAYVFDRRQGRLVADTSAIGLPYRSAHVAGEPAADATTTFRAPGVRIRLARVGMSWQLTTAMGGLSIDAALDEMPGPQTVCVVAPVPGGVADCTHKTTCLRLEGRASAGGSDYDLAGHWGTIDHTSGLLARRTAWRWASACGDGLALNLTEGFTAPAENVVWIGGRVEPVGPVRFAFDPGNPVAPWNITGDRGDVDLEFTPEGRRQENRNLVLAVSRYVQPIGTFRGRIGAAVVEGLVGVTEDHTARW
jgi:hypothetical protein